MNRLEDLGTGFEGYARRKDPETSHEAAEAVDALSLSQEVLQALDHSLFGMTTGEIASRLGKLRGSITPRMAPLERRGLAHRAYQSDGSLERRGGSIVWRHGAITQIQSEFRDRGPQVAVAPPEDLTALTEQMLDDINGNEIANEYLTGSERKTLAVDLVALGYRR